MKTLIASILVFLSFSGIAQEISLDPYASENVEERDARMQWFREARFGLFIHWGVYAVPAGTYKGEQIPRIGEWIMYHGKIPMAEYQAFAKEFNPVKYDPDAWVRMAKDAGMKYIVITSKHHDGFALFDSKVSQWDVVDATPYGKDLIAPLAEACKKHGIRLGLYYSQAQDWNQGGSARQKWDPAQDVDMDDYIDQIAVPQVKEILTAYNPDILWWDTPVDMNKERADKLIPLIKLRPGIIHNNRLGGGYDGDISTPEQHIPGTGLPGDWESCMTMNNTWGYKSYDNNWKSAPQLIRNLVDIASKGGNYLLNVGPTAEGLIPEPSVERLKAMGDWMKENGESIYGTSASPCSRPPWGRITKKLEDGNTILYLHVFNWPEDGKLFIPVDNLVTGCSLLAENSRTFKAESNSEGTTVQLTGEAPDPVCSVIKLKLQGPVSLTAANQIQQDRDGKILLSAERALINSHFGSHTEHNAVQDCIDQWTNANVTVEWTFNVKETGEFTVRALTASMDSASLSANLEKQSLKAELAPSGSFTEFKAREIGTITIDKAGEHTLILKPDKDQWKQLNLRSLELIPVPKKIVYQDDPKLQWWRDAKLGLFMHWGPSSVAGVEISWARESHPLDHPGRHEKMPDEEYDQLYKAFNPVKFDADKWMKLAKEAGFKYIVFTAKHHDGFSMFHTELRDYNIANTPFERDICKELADAAHKYGLKLGWYYSTRDWSHPDYHVGDNSKYNEFYQGQVKELLTSYGDVDIMWFDHTAGTWDDYTIPDLFDMMYDLQGNDLLVNNRAARFIKKKKGGKYEPEDPALKKLVLGDFDTPEQKIGKFQTDRAWESCMTMTRCSNESGGGGWSYRPDGTTISYKETVQTLVYTAVGDGNLLLNVGPLPSGEFPADQVKILKKMGKWLEKNGESIYGTRGGPVPNGNWGGMTFKDNKIYVHVLNWPEDGSALVVPAPDKEIIGSKGLNVKDPKVKLSSGNLEISLPSKERDEIDSIIILETK